MLTFLHHDIRFVCCITIVCHLFWKYWNLTFSFQSWCGCSIQFLSALLRHLVNAITSDCGFLRTFCWTPFYFILNGYTSIVIWKCTFFSGPPCIWAADKVIMVLHCCLSTLRLQMCQFEAISGCVIWNVCEPRMLMNSSWASHAIRVRLEWELYTESHT